MNDDHRGGSEQSQRIESLFHELVELPEPEREARLAAESSRDSEVASRVRALLAAAGEAEGFFAALPARVEAARADDAGADLRGRRVGAYVIDALIGRGGMGAVYRAHRADEQYEKHVAIKLVPQGLLTATARERFRQERQMLARLEHPNIARLLDGGVLEDGTPYLVMELVDGLPLDQWCDARKLGVPERVKLLLPVLDAVQYAHQSLVLHRDLKPDNVLVSERGEVKLLDFGIARTLDESAVEGTLTRQSSPLTPAYASPEQLRGDSLTTSSDVYSLGAMAYALLTGSRAHDVTGKSTAEIARILSEQPPRRPSTVARDPGDAAATERAAMRGASPESLARSLAGDLDTVVLTAMHADPARRYASASAFAADLRAHLDGRPVSARRDSARYVFSRFVRRHRAATSLAAVGLVLVLGFAFAIAALSARHAREMALERQKAEREARTANATARYLESLFEFADPDQNNGKPPTLPEVLGKSERRLGAELATQPALLANAYRLLGRLYWKLDDATSAMRLNEQSIALRRAAGASDRLQLARDIEWGGIMLRMRGDRGGAQDSLIDEVRRIRRQARADSTQLAHGWTAEGDLALARLQWSRADSVLSLARRGYRAGAPVDSAGIVGALASGGAARAQLGRAAEAESLLREQVRWATAVFGPAHTETAQAWFVLGSMQVETQRPDEAVKSITRARDLWLATLGEDAVVITRTDDYLGRAYMLQGRYREAAACFERVLAAQTRRLGAEHPYVYDVHNSLGVLFRDAEDYPNAIRHLRTAVDGLVRTGHGEHGNTIRAVINLANACIADGQLESGERWLARAESSMRRQPEPEVRQEVVLAFARVRIAHARGRWTEAERGYREILPAQRALYPSRHTMVALAEFHYGRFLVDRHRPAEAESLLASALGTFEAIKGPEHLSTARARVILADALHAVGRHREAEASLARGLAVYRRHLAESHVLMREARAVEARVRASRS